MAMRESLHPKSNSIATIALRLAITAMLLILVVRTVDFTAALESILNADWIFLGAMLAVLVCDRFIAAWRWYLLLPRARGATLLRVLRLILISGFAGFAIPGSIGVEAIRVYGVAKGSGDFGMAMASVLVERLFALIALAGMVLGGLWLLPSGMAIPDAIGELAMLGLVALVVGTCMMMSSWMRRISLRMLHGKTLTNVRRHVSEFYLALDQYRNRWGLLGISLAAAVVFQFGRVLLALLGALALGTTVDPVYFVIFMPIIILVTLIPLSIGGLGVQEVGFIYLFGLVGMTAEVAFMVSVLLHLAKFLTMIPGAWMYWRGGFAL